MGVSAPRFGGQLAQIQQKMEHLTFLHFFAFHQFFNIQKLTRALSKDRSRGLRCSLKLPTSDGSSATFDCRTYVRTFLKCSACRKREGKKVRVKMQMK